MAKRLKPGLWGSEVRGSGPTMQAKRARTTVVPEGSYLWTILLEFWRAPPC